jgi:hypothetical protein
VHRNDCSLHIDQIVFAQTANPFAQLTAEPRRPAMSVP